MKNELLSWALKYIKYYSIIPVGHDKKPLVQWQKYQNEKATEPQIREWFDKPNPPNIAIITGAISGITVVDVEKGGKWEDYPITQTSKSGGGGYHLYYRYAPGIQNRARVKELTDIRGDGGYIIAPPSIHASGTPYEWFRKEVTQPFPYQMFNVMPEVKKTQWEEVMKGVGEGGRNQSAAQIIGKFLATLPPEDWMTTAWQMTVIWNQSNTPPLVERELRATFNSILGREVRNGNSKARRQQTPEGEKPPEPADDVEVKLISQIAGDITDDMTVSYPTGYKIIDENFMGGLKEGDLFFITGYTGLGKTTFAQSMTYNLDKAGQPTLWFSFEVPIGEMWRKFKDMKVSDEFQAYSPEKIIANSIEWIKKKVIEARDRYKTKVVFIDHLGFLATEPKNYDVNASNNLATILGIICRQLKTLAIQENVAIVLLGHVRKPVSGDKGEPNIHDIKDSAAVAQETDAVLIIHRKRSTDQAGGEVYDPQTTIKIEKNRRTGINRVFKVSMFEGRLIDDDEFIDKTLGL